MVRKTNHIKPIDLFFSAGEQSGDLCGAEIFSHLKKQDPSLIAAGVCGEEMQKMGISPLISIDKLNVMGFSGILLSLPRLIRTFFKVKKAILRLQPKTVVLIDSPAFNLPLAAALRKSHFKGTIVQYVCPSVWAWRKKRIKKMELTLNHLISIFPFEKKHFIHAKLPVTYVGHPLVDKIAQHNYDENFDLGNSPILGIFPGSRKGEIKKNFAKQLKVAKVFTEMKLAVSVSHPRLISLLSSIAAKEKIPVTFVQPTHRYELMKNCKAAIATSGTITIELALHNVPTVVTYAINSFDLFLATKIFNINLSHYCIVNLITNRRLFPELYGPNFTEKNLLEAIKEILSQKYSPVKNLILDSLGNTRALTETSNTIYGLLSPNSC